MIPYRTPHVLLGLLVFGFAAAITTGVRAQQTQPGAANAPAAATPVIPPRPNPSDVMKNWPVYPEALRRTGEQGTVLLQIRVDADGVPRQIGVARSSKVALLDEAAVRAVSRWRFSPATRGGQPVAATVSLPIDFRLKDPPPAAAATPAGSKAAARTQPAKPVQPAKPAAAKPKAVAEPKAGTEPKPAAAPPSAGRPGLAMPPSLTLPPPQ